VFTKGQEMPAKALLREAQHLKDVCQRLDLLAEQHPHVSDAILTISGSIRSTATVLEVLVTTRLDPPKPI